ncbi:hypothetical protein T492DRAFT_1000005 [Pavlovales sp. CCMP2436]|nr:hypothetical protein T492DRAFT_1000005 [Pavlovales sp. CCMP2436]
MHAGLADEVDGWLAMELARTSELLPGGPAAREAPPPPPQAETRSGAAVARSGELQSGWRVAPPPPPRAGAWSSELPPGTSAAREAPLPPPRAEAAPRAKRAHSSRAEPTISRSRSGREMKEAVARIVKGILHEYFTTGRIANKEDFKHLAREITHKWCAKLEARTHESWPEERLRAKINKHILQQFERSFIYVRGGSASAAAPQ